jgi:DNA-binding HxlR family transcriptional regulator
MSDQACFPSCATRALLDLVSEKWVLLVLDRLSAEPVRFLELQRRIGPISEKSLTATLRRLESHGLLTRTIYPEVPPRVDYRLTALGVDLAEQLLLLRAWAERHATVLRLPTDSTPAA